MKTYTEKLKDPRWQKKRLEIFERDRYVCQICGRTTRELQVHHWIYRKGMEPWEQPNEDMITVCKNCHQAIHRSIEHYQEDDELTKGQAIRLAKEAYLYHQRTDNQEDDLQKIIRWALRKKTSIQPSPAFEARWGLSVNKFLEKEYVKATWPAFYYFIANRYWEPREHGHKIIEALDLNEQEQKKLLQDFMDGAMEE